MKRKITSLKGNFLTSTLLKNYLVPILCRPVNSRLSAGSNVRLTKITIFRCYSRKRASPIRRYGRWPRGSLMQMMNGHSHEGRFCLYENACRKCWGLERQACLPSMREERCSSRLGVNGRWLVRNWYAVFLIALKATNLEACRISHANPSSVGLGGLLVRLVICCIQAPQV